MLPNGQRSFKQEVFAEISYKFDRFESLFMFQVHCDSNRFCEVMNN